MSNGGKGSTPRPISVSNEEYAARWDVIFGRDKPKDPTLDRVEEILIPQNEEKE